MMTAQFKNALRLAVPGRITVVNAGHAAYDSLRIQQLYEARVSAFSPDLVLYYEAWNEQPVQNRTFRRAEEEIVNLQSWNFHRVLYNRSFLYTYLLEKYELSASGSLEATLWRKARFWKIDVANFANESHGPALPRAP